MKKPETICILLNATGPGSGSDELDVLVQADEISASLKNLGYRPVRTETDLDLGKALTAVRATGADKVFNLVESLDGSDGLIHLVPAVLEQAGVPFTGSSAEAMFLTTNKPLSKRIMTHRGIATPAFIDLSPERPALPGPGEYIIKSAWEHASAGIGDDSIVTIGSEEDIIAVREKFSRRFRSPKFFAEKFIEGREFNISLLEGPAGPEVLPHAEIIFSGFEGKRKIVGYGAKWDDSSHEYLNTRRNFDFPDKDRTLLQDLTGISLECWRLFGLRGYARVDFRVDEQGGPWVLEVNVNPCLSRDAGFMAAAFEGGYTHEKVIELILKAV